MNLSRPWLLPFVPFYYLGSLFVKKMYDWRIWKSTAYKFPVITVGNISVGGTGKSPFVAYLLCQFSSKYNLATLSRGYGRTTKGFQLLKIDHLANEVGDEPLQFKTNYPRVTVAVDADRRNGISRLKREQHNLNAIILDDAFQHRKVKGGLQIVLTPYYKLYINDMLLPAGDLREPKSAADRANIIVVTKCPLDISVEERFKITESLSVSKDQQLFFTGIEYAKQVFGSSPISLETFLTEQFDLVTGIANPQPLIDFLKNRKANFKHHYFKDHHNFSKEEVYDLSTKNRILTTEKDFMRLKNYKLLKGKLYYLPIQIVFLDAEKEFLEQVNHFLDS